MDPDISHIINGHVPVKIKDGETPVKANGKLFVIDGGISKAYQPRTGIAGYTMIFNSHHLALAEHTSFDQIENDDGSYTPKIQIVVPMPRRLKIADIDLGDELEEKINDLRALIDAYRNGVLKERITDS
jgi:fructose-1,6-bisphosphatase-3